MANARVLSHTPLVTTDLQYRNWSLSGLVESLLESNLPKPNHIRCGNWEKFPLDIGQRRYAALDAYAGLALYRVLSVLPLRSELGRGTGGRRSPEQAQDSVSSFLAGPPSKPKTAIAASWQVPQHAQNSDSRF
eukprot:gene22474-29596_t